MAELTKREARLKDVFQKQVANFREAVYCLFGYRVDMASEAQGADSAHKGAATFVLKPQFGDSSRMQLMFRFHKGRMELLPTDFTERKLKREVETFIDRWLPCLEEMLWELKSARSCVIVAQGKYLGEV